MTKILERAAERSDSLIKWGERTKYLGVGVGAASLAAMKYMGIDDPDTISRWMVVPAAVVFAAGEGARVLGEYARDVRNGETNPVKNAGYLTRIAAPIYAAINGADGVWSGENDVAVPIVSWVAGVGTTEVGKRRINAAKRSLARNFLSEEGEQSVIETIVGHNPDYLIDAAVRDVPMKDMIKEN